MNKNQLLNMMKTKCNNPIFNNAIQMAQAGNSKGVEQLARNLCNSKGINPDDSFNKMKAQLGIK